MMTPPQRHPAGIDPLLVSLPPCTVLSRAAYATRAELPRPGRRVPILLTGAAPRYIDMKRSRSDSNVFRLSPSRVVFTRWPEPSQARLVVPPEPFDATCCQCVFRVLLQLPTRDQVFTAFVYIQDDRQHRRPSVRSPLRVCSTPYTPSPRRT